jgi:trigger factor
MREVKRRFGEGILQEVSSEVMQSSFAEAVRSEAVLPAGVPQIEDVRVEAGKDLEFTAVFEVFPEINLGDFSGISVERPISSVTDDDISTMIETLREQRTEFVEVDRACKEGDKVNVDFNGFVDDEEFEGGKSEGSDIVLGSGSMIPGFEDGIIGASKDEEKDVDVSFPEEYHSKDLAGKAAVFKIKINAISEPVVPELDDEFFENFGVAEGGVEAFRTEVATNMQKELEAAIKNKVKNQVMDGLFANNEIDLPRALVDQEIDRMRHEAIHQFGGHNEIDPSMLPAEMFTVQAKKRVSLGLLVNAIVEQYEVKPDDARVKETIESMASSYEDPEQIISYYYGNEEQLSKIQNLVLEDQVIDTILAAAAVTDIQQEYEEAIKPAEQAESKDSAGDTPDDEPVSDAPKDAED